MNRINFFLMTTGIVFSLILSCSLSSFALAPQSGVSTLPSMIEAARLIYLQQLPKIIPGQQIEDSQIVALVRSLSQKADINEWNHLFREFSKLPQARVHQVDIHFVIPENDPKNFPICVPQCVISDPVAKGILIKYLGVYLNNRIRTLGPKTIYVKGLPEGFKQEFEREFNGSIVFRREFVGIVENVEALFTHLKEKGYIKDERGLIGDNFKKIGERSKFKLGEMFVGREQEIYDILARKSKQQGYSDTLAYMIANWGSTSDISFVDSIPGIPADQNVIEFRRHTKIQGDISGKYFVGIDVGGTSIHAIIVDEHGNIIGEKQEVPTFKSESKKKSDKPGYVQDNTDFINRMAALVRQAVADAQLKGCRDIDETKLTGIGIGWFGNRARDAALLDADTLKPFAEIDNPLISKEMMSNLSFELSRRLRNVPVKLLGDSESWGKYFSIDLGQQIGKTYHLKYGTSIGGAYYDENGFYPRGFHMPSRVVINMSPDAIEHTASGVRGCFQGYAASRGYEEVLKNVLRAHPEFQDTSVMIDNASAPSILEEWLSSKNPLKIEIVGKVADEVAKSLRTDISSKYGRRISGGNKISFIAVGVKFQGEFGKIVLAKLNEKFNSNVNFSFEQKPFTEEEVADMRERDREKIFIRMDTGFSAVCLQKEVRSCKAKKGSKAIEPADLVTREKAGYIVGENLLLEGQELQIREAVVTKMAADLATAILELLNYYEDIENVVLDGTSLRGRLGEDIRRKAEELVNSHRVTPHHVKLELVVDTLKKIPSINAAVVVKELGAYAPAKVAEQEVLKVSKSLEVQELERKLNENGPKNILIDGSIFGVGTTMFTQEQVERLNQKFHNVHFEVVAADEMQGKVADGKKNYVILNKSKLGMPLARTASVVYVDDEAMQKSFVSASGTASYYMPLMSIVEMCIDKGVGGEENTDAKLWERYNTLPNVNLFQVKAGKLVVVFSPELNAERSGETFGKAVDKLVAAAVVEALDVEVPLAVERNVTPGTNQVVDAKMSYSTHLEPTDEDRISSNSPLYVSGTTVETLAAAASPEVGAIATGEIHTRILDIFNRLKESVKASASSVELIVHMKGSIDNVRVFLSPNVPGFAKVIGNTADHSVNIYVNEKMARDILTQFGELGEAFVLQQLIHELAAFVMMPAIEGQSHVTYGDVEATLARAGVTKAEADVREYVEKRSAVEAGEVGYELEALLLLKNALEQRFGTGLLVKMSEAHSVINPMFLSDPYVKIFQELLKIIAQQKAAAPAWEIVDATAGTVLTSLRDAINTEVHTAIAA